MDARVVDALLAGSLAYRLIPNLTPVTLFAVRLPIVDPSNTDTYLRKAERALKVFMLNRVWYSCVENKSAFSDEDLNFYSTWISHLNARLNEQHQP